MIGLLLALAAGAADPVGCQPLPGADAFARTTKARWILLGERGHGTVERPRAVIDLICALERTGRPVTVALEYIDADQARIDAYLKSDGGEAAKRTLFASRQWDPAWADGKSSIAMLDLLDRLRVMAQAGRIRRVVPFDATTTTGSADRNRQMTRNLARIDAGPNGVIVVFTGAYHTQRRPAVEQGEVVRSPGNLLPAARSVSIRINGNGGTAWKCTDRCGLHDLEPRRAAARGLIMRPTRDGQFDGVLELGTRETASPPANAGPSR